MSLSIDLTNLPKRKQRVTLTERQLREAKMENRIAEQDELLDILEHILPDDFHADQPIAERVRLLVERVSELEQQLAEAQAKAELWDKIRLYFKLSYYWRSGDNDGFSFQVVIPHKTGESLEDAVRRLP